LWILRPASRTLSHEEIPQEADHARHSFVS
jgi:hypothetical protein